MASLLAGRPPTQDHPARTAFAALAAMSTVAVVFGLIGGVILANVLLRFLGRGFL